MADWESLRCFAALARSGTLLGAARMLGVEHATIARRVAALEAETGLALVDRRGRRLRLTADGERVARLAGQMEDSAGGLELIRAASSGRLSGEVRVSAPPSLAASLLAEPVAELRRLHPDIEITLAGETRYASLDRREADIAVRMSRPETGDVVLSRLGCVDFRLCAVPDYLTTVAPADWRFIAYDEAMDSAPQSVRLRDYAAGRRMAVRAPSLEFQRAAALAGVGIACLPDFMLRGVDGLTSPPGEAVLLTREVWLVLHAQLRDAPPVRAVADVLRRSLAARLKM